MGLSFFQLPDSGAETRVSTLFPAIIRFRHSPILYKQFSYYTFLRIGELLGEHHG